MASWTITPSGDVVLCLTYQEARGLLHLAEEGAGKALGEEEDRQGAIALFGGQEYVEGAEHALDAIGDAVVTRRPPSTPSTLS
jgi:hypothetical protein